jgi:hypothetical protein
VTELPRPAAIAGWYADPEPDPGAPGGLRYFDGTGWTEHTAPLPTAPLPPVPLNLSVLPDGFVPAPYAGPAPGFGASPSDPIHWLLPTGRTWQSIVAGYLALFALLFWCLGPVVLALGVYALYASSAGHGHGRGRAWFAVVVGMLSTLALFAVLTHAI